ncbi:MAG: ATP-dependent ligase [Thermoleophilia bacterium]|nr:ATP-dependent ligase [Thermoleophilia bacterium]MCZ4497328.1 ATP-dependent ligase [Thermoleophilia bacterium]
MAADIDILTLQPMLATSVGEPPEGAEWCYEPKWDGMRAMFTLHPDGSAQLLTRAGRDIATGFPELLERPAALVGRSAVVDGEIIAPDPDTGAGSFARLQRRIGVLGIQAARLGRLVPVSFVAFDVLALDGVPLLDATLDQRRRELEKIVPGTADTAAVPSRWQLVQRLVGSGHEAYAAALEAGHEGIVAKRTASHYTSGERDSAWRKVVRMPREEFVVVGWIPSLDDAARPGALAVASRTSPGMPLEYVDMIERGIGIREREMLHTSFLTRYSEAPTAIGMPATPGMQFVKPDIVIEVAHNGSSIDHQLRSPRFLGVRPDRDPISVARDPYWA